MITLKMNPYNDKEKKLLHSMFIDACAVIQNLDECEGDCASCTLKHICYDIHAVERHLRRCTENDHIISSRTHTK